MFSDLGNKKSTLDQIVKFREQSILNAMVAGIDLHEMHITEEFRTLPNGKLEYHVKITRKQEIETDNQTT